ncbi:MAG: DUF2470 domain-containing protein [Pseudomonadota bacterium]
MKKDVLQPVDDEARRLAGGLLRSERSGALATLDPESGHPLASRVSVATQINGRPLILISRLSAHFGALEGDARCSLLLGRPGKGDPLAHARMTIVARAEMLEGESRAIARSRFLAAHPKAELYVDFADFAFWSLSPDSASLNGGFARAYALSRDDLIAPIDPGLAQLEPGAVSHMNEDHADAVKLYAEVLLGREAADWRLTGIDQSGLDMAAGDEVARLWFDRPLEGPEAVRPKLVMLAKQARGAAAT